MASITNTPTFSLTYLEAVRDVQYQMVAAFSFLVWDLLLTFGEEVEYIWGMRPCMSKWFYFYFRYFLLVAQIFHLAVSPSLSSGRTPDFLCKTWYRYLVFIPQITICMVEIILATRVFALFNRSRKVGIFLGSLILLQLGCAGLVIAQCSTTEYFEACILPHPRKEIANPLTSITMIVQSIVTGMIIFKHFVGIRLGWGRTPLLSFLVRDATNYYVMMFLLCGLSMAVCGLDDLRVTAVVYWSISVYSAIGCHLILNMERFARGNPLDEEVQFTSHISL